MDYAEDDAPETLELRRRGHALHCRQCLMGLPGREVGLDYARVSIVFYCLGGLDLLGEIDKMSQDKRNELREGIWKLQTRAWIPAFGKMLADGEDIEGEWGGFKGSSHMTIDPEVGSLDPVYDPPHLVMTYTSILSLAILRDDFSQLRRSSIQNTLRACQLADGGFNATPVGGDCDLRLLYCAFVIANMLEDWSGIDVMAAIEYIRRCRTHEGGYGQQPHGEAIGGTTYCALAALALAESSPSSPPSARLTPQERKKTIRWLILQQSGTEGGFSGRTNKVADACYCFWCGASLAILGVGELVHASAQAQFLAACHGKFGGIAKVPDESADPYHTYLSLAALSIFPAPAPTSDLSATVKFDESWKLPELDPLLNAKLNTARWVREYVPRRSD